MIKQRIRNLIPQANGLGLSVEDAGAIESLIDNGEFKVAMEWLIDQLYEYDIEIDQAFFEQALKISQEVDIQNDRIDLLRSLVSL